VQWSRLEGYVDLIATYLHKKSILKPDAQPPAAFNARVKYIRRALKSHIFVNLLEEANALLDKALVASRKRNDLVHGLVTTWSNDSSAIQTNLRRGDNGYVAVQGVAVTYAAVEALCREVWHLSIDLFHVLERIKAITRFLDGDEAFWRNATIQANYD
jgi:hypothetical protein